MDDEPKLDDIQREELANVPFQAAPGTGKALALVTAGPGLTNTLTGLAGAWLESRELLLLGGQVKVEDLAPAGLRQLGIQEVDGVAMAAPVCKRSLCLRAPLPAEALLSEVPAGTHTVVAWHPPLGPGEQPRTVRGTVTVGSGSEAKVELRLAP